MIVLQPLNPRSILKIRFLAPILLAALLSFSSAEAWAATVKISNFSSISFGTWNGSGSFTRTLNLCVYSSDTAGYNITASSGGAFQLTDGGSHTIDFDVYFNSVQLTHGVSHTFNSGADQSSTSCSGGTNATLQVDVGSSALHAARPGDYSATLYILLEPSP